VGGALIGGARLALSPRFAPEHFWDEARRYGATVVFYAGEMCRPLVDAPPDRADAHNPVRLFLGSGMRADIWERLHTRFDSGVLEFYASTEGNAVLANASGEKVGSLGRPLPGSTQMELLRWDFAARDFERDAGGRPVRARPDEPGMLVARVDPGHPMAGFDGYLDQESTQERVVRDVFEEGDRWFVTRDLLRKDDDGDWWFVDRLGDVILTADGPVFSREVEDVLYHLRDVQRVSVYGVTPGKGSEQVVVAAVVPREGELDFERFTTHVLDKLAPEQRPQYVRIVDDIATSEGYRPLKRLLVDQGLRRKKGLWTLDGDCYVPHPAKKTKGTAKKKARKKRTTAPR